MFSKRAITIFATTVVTALALGALSACEPQGKAVGNTGRVGDIIHDGVDIEDIHLLVIGSKLAALDDEVMKHCKTSKLSASYVPLSNVVNPNEAAQQAIRAASEQPVSLILIDALDVTSVDDPHNANNQSNIKENNKLNSTRNKQNESKAWISALQYARYAGVPVALINPVKAPKDATLYAAILRVGDIPHNLAPERSSLLSIVRAIIDNTPHSREVIINDK
ncbi:hypothetical protein CJI50_05495 [Bifidobacteriaceae bacterium NR021]|uniref:hypothetical protein n=1 Tax=Gardnerella swidsinskii TaxID=2792979 RepID=UPI000E690C25|nr:hypothetical protein CJI50_05495 [Bifidobacteriaceae bacterium NR021]